MISNFVIGVDKIDLSDLGITFADITLTQSATRTIVNINTDGIAGADMQIDVRPAGVLTTSDFHFI